MQTGDSLRRLRETKPLIHQITNYVVMNEAANATLALGALPVMAHAREEVEEMVALAGALVLGRKPETINVRPAAGRGGAGGGDGEGGGGGRGAAPGGGRGGPAAPPGSGIPGSTFNRPTDVAWDLH